ncbi:MAG: DHA2 family efflux MFS transporter permease subunit [Kineosporiaceae bacterium]
MTPPADSARPAAPAVPRSSGPGADTGVLRWLVLATFIVILNETIMVNAIPRLMVEFDVTARAAQWLSTAFMLTMATVIPVTGWFLQRVTTRQAFTLAMLTFCAGTLIAALAPFFWVLVAGRVVQAAGTAVMMPLLMTTIMTVVPPHERGRVMGNVSLAISVAPALGPAVSGGILALTSWRGLFLVVLPVALGITVVSLRSLTDVGEPTAGRVDVVSVVLAALGFGSLVYGLSGLGESSGGSVPPEVPAVVGVVVVALFVIRQLRLQRTGEPLLDLRVLRLRTYTVSITLMAVAFMAMLGAMILLPLYLQEVRGLTPLATGLAVAPGGILMGLLGPRVGKAFDRVGSRPLVVPGAVVLVVALGMLTLVGESTPVAYVIGAHVLLMISLAAIFTPVFTLGLGALPAHLYSHGSSLLGTTQQVAGAIGTAASISVLSVRGAALAEDGASEAAVLVGGLQWAFGLAAVLSVAVVVLAVMLPRRASHSAHGAAPEPDAVKTAGQDHVTDVDEAGEVARIG